jgi:hypothetical protein
LAICGKEATFVLFDRAKITHSPPINLETDLETFVEAAIGLFSLGAEDFGYDTRFSWFPALTGEVNDRETARELRLKQDNDDWQVLEVLCQRKCVLGRATTVMRVGRVRDPDDNCATKMTWTPISRTPEAECLENFKDITGIVQCLWSDEGRSTALEGSTLKRSPYQSHFLPGISVPDYHAINESMKEPSNSKGRDVLNKGASEARQQVAFALEERQKHTVLMPEGTALWHIKRFLHLIIVMRDAIVGKQALKMRTTKN